jgi:oxygen-independent coproporphyrinogen-3 oxidase
LAGRDISIDEDMALELYQMAINNPYFQQYEVSNYAVSTEFQCLHNKNVWRGGTLLGFGPAASSFDGQKRFTQSYSLADYLGDKNIDYDLISPEERRNEIFAVNLRTCDGWTREFFEKKYPNSFDKYLEKILFLSDINPEFFDYSAEHIRLTPQGLLFWDEIASELL